MYTSEETRRAVAAIVLETLERVGQIIEKDAGEQLPFSIVAATAQSLAEAGTTLLRRADGLEAHDLFSEDALKAIAAALGALIGGIEPIPEAQAIMQRCVFTMVHHQNQTRAYVREASDAARH